MCAVCNPAFGWTATGRVVTPGVTWTAAVRRTTSLGLDVWVGAVLRTPHGGVPTPVATSQFWSQDYAEAWARRAADAAADLAMRRFGLVTCAFG